LAKNAHPPSRERGNETVIVDSQTIARAKWNKEKAIDGGKCLEKRKKNL
jgi:hypothetical protein